MLLIEGWIKLAAGEFEKVRDQAIAMITATNQEDGCLLSCSRSENGTIFACQSLSAGIRA